MINRLVCKFSAPLTPVICILFYTASGRNLPSEHGFVSYSFMSAGMSDYEIFQHHLNNPPFMSHYILFLKKQYLPEFEEDRLGSLIRIWS